MSMTQDGNDIFSQLPQKGKSTTKNTGFFKWSLNDEVHQIKKDRQLIAGDNGIKISLKNKDDTSKVEDPSKLPKILLYKFKYRDKFYEFLKLQIE